MSPVDKEVLTRLIRLLEKNVARLRRLQIRPARTEPDSPDWALERGIEVSIQGVLDIGAHILAAHPVGPIDDYTAIIDGLTQLGVLSQELGSRIRPLPGLRNLLVHDYAEIDSNRLAAFAETRLGDFDGFIAEVSVWLERSD